MIKKTRILLLTFALLALQGCEALTEYNKHVAAREESLSGYSKDGDYGARFTHRVEYR